MKKIFGQKRGVSLISALIVLSMLIFVGIGLLFYTSGSFSRVQGERRGTGALYAAEAGIDYGCWWLKENQSQWTNSNVGAVVLDDQDISLGRGTFDVRITVLEVNGTPTRFEIISTGYVPNYAHCKPADKRTVRALVTLQLPAISDFAIASDGSLYISGSVVVDSYPKAHKGNVGSNDWVYLSGGENLIIDGNVSGYNGINPGGATITGRQITGRLLEFPEIDTQTKYNQAVQDGIENGWGNGTGIKIVDKNWNINEDMTLGGVIVGPGAVGGKGPNKVGVDVAVTGSAVVTLNGVLWIDGNFKLGGNAKIQGQGTIVVTGTIDLQGTSSHYADRPNDHLAFVSLSSSDPAITIGGNFSASGKTGGGLFYAPNGGVKIDGEPHIYGAVAANQVTVNGNPHITYDTRSYKEPYLNQIPRPDTWEKKWNHLR